MEPITWELFEKQVAECRLCSLCSQIKNKVPGQGDRRSPLMFIGEGPGRWRTRRAWPLWARRASC